MGDLEIGYLTRGYQIAACDTARRLAVQTLLAERDAAEAARGALRNAPRVSAP